MQQRRGGGWVCWGPIHPAAAGFAGGPSTRRRLGLAGIAQNPLFADDADTNHAQEDGGAYGAWLAYDVVCHETAHQWFGNLVTGRNWTQLAFNEGLASWAEYACITAVSGGAVDGETLRYRAPLPQGRRAGVHEGPSLKALGTDQDPFRPAMVPVTDASMGTGKWLRVGVEGGVVCRK